MYEIQYVSIIIVLICRTFQLVFSSNWHYCLKTRALLCSDEVTNLICIMLWTQKWTQFFWLLRNSHKNKSLISQTQGFSSQTEISWPSNDSLQVHCLHRWKSCATCWLIFWLSSCMLRESAELMAAISKAVPRVTRTNSAISSCI